MSRGCLAAATSTAAACSREAHLLHMNDFELCTLFCRVVKVVVPDVALRRNLAASASLCPRLRSCCHTQSSGGRGYAVNVGCNLCGLVATLSVTVLLWCSLCFMCLYNCLCTETTAFYIVNHQMTTSISRLCPKIDNQTPTSQKWFFVRAFHCLK